MDATIYYPNSCFLFLSFFFLLFAYFQLLFINNIALMSSLLLTFLCIDFLFQSGWSNHDQIYFSTSNNESNQKEYKTLNSDTGQQTARDNALHENRNK